MKLLIIKWLFISLSIISTLATLHANEYRPAYLQITQTNENHYEMLWKIPRKGQRLRIGLYIILPENTKQTKIQNDFTDDAFIERSIILVENGLAGKEITIRGLAQTSANVFVRIYKIDGTSETISLNSLNTSFVVKDNLKVYDVINSYLKFGIEHILKGYDHLLFIACLIFIAKTKRRIIITITGFTIAHSVTLTLATFEWIKIPNPPIEASIALSIVFLAREIILDKHTTLTWKYPITVSTSFGLLHGLGFASALNEIGLPQIEIPAALLAFNIGVEIGQLIYLAAILTVIWSISNMLNWFQKDVAYWRYTTKKPIALAIGGIAMYWTLERVTNFWA